MGSEGSSGLQEPACPQIAPSRTGPAATQPHPLREQPRNTRGEASRDKTGGKRAQTGHGTPNDSRGWAADAPGHAHPLAQLLLEQQADDGVGHAEPHGRSHDENLLQPCREGSLRAAKTQRDGVGSVAWHQTPPTRGVSPPRGQPEGPQGSPQPSAAGVWALLLAGGSFFFFSFIPGKGGGTKCQRD